MLTSDQVYRLQLFIIIATILAPIIAVVITIWLQNRKDKMRAKRDLFFTLFSLRGLPDSPQFVNALNTIEAYFDDNQKVLEAWNNYYQDLRRKDSTNPQENWLVLRVRLLSEMAKVLGYKKFDQTTLMQHYIPQSLDDFYRTDNEIRASLLNYLKVNAKMSQLMIDRFESDKGTPPPVA